MAERSADYDQYAPLLERYAALPADDPARAGLHEQLVTAFLPLARNIAQRFSRRSEPADDLEQVAAVGLLHALARFDPARGGDFLSYAVPTMMGEVRRYFRDSTWTVRTPRSVKDRFLSVGTASSAMSQDLGRAPTVTELATHLGLSRDEVAEAVAVRGSFRPASLDEGLEDADDSALIEVLGVADAGLDQAELRVAMADLVARLPERERRLLALRFVHEKTQAEVGADLGISQMHVSRLLTRTLEALRDEIERQRAADRAPIAGG